MTKTRQIPTLQQMIDTAEEVGAFFCCGKLGESFQKCCAIPIALKVVGIEPDFELMETDPYAQFLDTFAGVSALYLALAFDGKSVSIEIPVHPEAQWTELGIAFREWAIESGRLTL